MKKMYAKNSNWKTLVGITLGAVAIVIAPIDAEANPAVVLDNVSYGGPVHIVLSDLGTPYNAPQWKQGANRTDPPQAFPICYTRNKIPLVKATFVLTGFKTTDKVWAKGEPIESYWSPFYFPVQPLNMNNGSYPEVAGKRTQDEGRTSALPNRVGSDYIGIRWQYSTNYQLDANGEEAAGVIWTDAGTSLNQLYVTFADPTATLYHTVIDIGCRTGKDIEPDVLWREKYAADIVDAIWGAFSGRSVARVENPTEPNQMGYWRTWTAWNRPHSCTAINTKQLLVAQNGQCGSWANFFQDCVKGQGISCEKIYVVTNYTSQAGNPKEVFGFNGALLVKNWTFGTSTLPGNYFDASTGKTWTHRADPASYPLNAIVYGNLRHDTNSGVPGQGNQNPPPDFSDHFIARYKSEQLKAGGGTETVYAYYDPSYGGGGFANAEEAKAHAAWEDASLAGFIKVFRIPSSTGITTMALAKQNAPGHVDNIETGFTASN